ncbi:MAG: adenylate/guanylate cyclase domain-containing protein [Spirochaetales bacterium]|nr:adenylate/guanylate cyclase domain-containing protein [Spirochaetales bacterium]
MKTILIISKDNKIKLKFDTCMKNFKKEVFELIQVPSTVTAENILFEREITLIIMDWEVDGAAGFTEDLKNDEMFRLVPVLALLPDCSKEYISRAMLSGADTYLGKQTASALSYLVIRPLVKNNVLNSELVNKLSQLQEQAIHDFILLDLIKKYIPKTIWDLANSYAYERKIKIPEEELELTIVFADIKEFTKMAHSLKPIEVIKTLNSVFQVVTKIIYDNHGDIDKFIGDAFLAVFEKAESAVKAAVLVQKGLEGLNRSRVQEKLNPILFRIGIHTGPIIRGNVGGNQRFDNTLIGSTVNIAAYLESSSKAGDILISEDTRKKAQLVIPAEYKRQVQLKGSNSSAIVYQVYEVLKNSY